MGVKIGDTVTLLNCDSNKVMEFNVVGVSMTTHFVTMGYKTKNYGYSVLDSGGDGRNTISLESPLGEAIAGHNEGDVVEYKAEGRKYQYMILCINRQLQPSDMEKLDDFKRTDPSENSNCIVEFITSENTNEKIYNSDRSLLSEETETGSDRVPNPSVADSNYDKELFEKLRGKRSELARVVKLPAYCIFNNSTLLELAIKKPRSIDELLTIKGMGSIKITQYGEEFLNVINAHMANSSDDDLCDVLENTEGNKSDVQEELEEECIDYAIPSFKTAEKPNDVAVERDLISFAIDLLAGVNPYTKEPLGENHIVNDEKTKIVLGVALGALCTSQKLTEENGQ